jgi:hypothetical protein
VATSSFCSSSLNTGASTFFGFAAAAGAALAGCLGGILLSLRSVRRAGRGRVTVDKIRRHPVKMCQTTKTLLIFLSIKRRFTQKK